MTSPRCETSSVSSGSLTERKTSHSRAHKAFFSRVSQLMIFEAVWLRERLPHCWHPNVFSPLWVFKWVFRVLDKEKDFTQVVQSNNFSPEWVNMCFFQVTRQREMFITLHTSIGLHPAMSPFVSCEILEFCEILATLLAGEVHAGRWLAADWGTEKRL